MVAMNTKIDCLNASRILSLNDIGSPVVPRLNEKRSQPHGGAAISRRICICCGEPMTARENSLSRNPNVCASCSSLSDGMEQEGNQSVENDDNRNTPGPLTHH
jgi:hypothetical protein